jgi:hypothetical protein
MATVHERVCCVGWLFEIKSVTQNQRNYRTEFNKPWPTHSPNIRPLDFFLYGYVRSNVFRIPVNGLDLKTRIRNAILSIPANMLHRTSQELEYGLDVLRATKVAHIEVYSDQ